MEGLAAKAVRNETIEYGKNGDELTLYGMRECEKIEIGRK